MSRIRAAVVALTMVVVALPACAVTGEPQQPGFAELRPLAPGESVTQTFVARVGPLDRFELLVANYENPDPDSVLELTLRGAGEERTARVSGGDIPDGAWLSFRFAPLGDAADEPFRATLTLTGTDPIAYYVNPEDPYPDGSLEGASGDLAFRVGHAGRWRGVLVAGTRVLEEFTQRLGNDLPFTLSWLATLAVTVAGLAWSWWRSRTADG